MELFGNYLRKNIPAWKKLVENELKVDLGTIDILPLPKCIDEIIEELHPSLCKKILFKLIGMPLIYLSEDFIAAKAGKSTVYYSRSPLVAIGSERDMTQTALHELGHIAHRKLLEPFGHEDYHKIPENVREGFAECVAIYLIQKLNMPPNINSRYYKSYRNLAVGRHGLKDIIDDVLVLYSPASLKV